MWLTLPTKTMITPRKARDDLRLHARDIFGSYKSNVRREQQGRDTKETDHFDGQAEKICLKNGASCFHFIPGRGTNSWNWTFLWARRLFDPAHIFSVTFLEFFRKISEELWGLTNKKKRLSGHTVRDPGPGHKIPCLFF